jgi:hypothetical protein
MTRSSRLLLSIPAVLMSSLPARHSCDQGDKAQRRAKLNLQVRGRKFEGSAGCSVPILHGQHAHVELCSKLPHGLWPEAVPGARRSSASSILQSKSRLSYSLLHRQQLGRSLHGD